MSAGAICAELWPLAILGQQSKLPAGCGAPAGAHRFSLSCFWSAAILFFVALFSSLRRPAMPSPEDEVPLSPLGVAPAYISLLLSEVTLRRSRLLDGAFESRSRFSDGTGMM